MIPIPSRGLMERYDRPGPRYTSYPTAVEFRPEVGVEAYRERLRAAAERDAPLSLYVHLPFCEERCLFCGCNVVVTRKRERAARYLDHLEREIRETARRLGARRTVSQYHWGGGTPTYLSPEQIRRLQDVVLQEFELLPDAEVAVEVDPRVTTRAHLEALRRGGFNRISVGVQDLDPGVQEAVHRIQPREEIEALVETSRALGFRSVNVDLIYGLPRQRPESFRRTLEAVLAMRPDRAAVYGYAHVPWLKGHQRKIDEGTLPGPSERLELFGIAMAAFLSGEYVAIGMDHFARPDDELGRAAQDGTLWRNFMGYTVRHAPDMIACGMSGIGEVGGAFLQNHAKLVQYERAIESHGLAVHRGHLPSPDDLMRRWVITSIMCRFRLDYAELEERHGVRFLRDLAAEREELRPLEEDGLVRVLEDRLEVTPLGRLFVRNVCMAFDAYLRRPAAAPRRFSRTV